MRLIYKHAFGVIVWLGLRTLGVEQAFEFARNLARLRNTQFQEASGGADRTRQDLWFHPEVNAVMLSVLNSRPEIADYLIQLFERDYFERTWCVQEVVASTLCLAKCEDLEMDFFELLSTTPYLEERRLGLGLDSIMTSPRTLQFWNAVLQSRFRSRVSTAQGSMGKLITLLNGIRDFKSTDPRDKVYALLGISDEGLEPVRALTSENFVRRAAVWMANQAIRLGVESHNIYRHAALRPNYEKSVKDVYRDLTRFLIRIPPGTLDVLSYVQHTSDPSQDSFPSWVPKWYEPRSVSVFGDTCFMAGIAEGHYSSFARVHDNPLNGEPLQPDSLRLDGFHIDRVEAVSEVIQFGQHGPLPAEKIWNELFDFPLFPRPNRQYVVNGEALDAAFFISLNIGAMGALLSAAPRLARMENSNAVSSAVAIDVMIRHAKMNIAAWLNQHPPARETSYPEFNAAVEANTFIGNADAFVRAAWSWCLNRRFYRTRLGLIGVGPQMMRPGDQVYVLLGGTLPFILRSRGNHFILIGDAYLHYENVLSGREVKAKRSRWGSGRMETLELR